MPVKKKTVSFSKVTLPALFKVMADILGEDTPLAEDLRAEIIKRVNPATRTSVQVSGFFDSRVSDAQMKSRLEKRTLEELKSVVQEFALDSSRTMSKVTDKQRVVDFIVRRRSGLLSRYEGFGPAAMRGEAREEEKSG